MPIRKIKAGLVLTKDVDTFVGEPGYIFYDVDTNGDLTLRLSDGLTPGGVNMSSGGSGTSRLNVIGDDSSGSLLNLASGTPDLKFTGTGGVTVSVADDVVTIDGSGVSGSGGGTLSMFADDSTNMEIDLATQDLQVSGGNSITTSTSSTQTLTVSLDDNITINSISSTDSTSIQVNDGLNVSGTLSADTIDTNVISSGDSTAVQVADDLIPSANDTYSLGSPLRQWSTLFVTGSTIYLGDLILQSIGQNENAKLRIKNRKTGKTVTDIDPDDDYDSEGASGTLDVTEILKVVGDDSTGAILNSHDTIKFRGGNNVTVTVDDDSSVGEAIVTINSTGGGGSAQGITFQADDSAGIEIADGGSVYIRGGTGIQTSANSDGTITITSTVSPAGINDATELQLGSPTDSSTFPVGAISTLTPTHSVADSIDDLNEALENVRNNTFVKSVDFTADNTVGGAGLVVTLTITTVGNPTRYDITWGDGDTTIGTTDSTPTHTYATNSGSPFNVTVRAYNHSGQGTGSEATETKANFITIYTANPTVDFDIYAGASGGSAITKCDLGSTVYMENTTTNTTGVTATFSMDWGDGVTETITANSNAGGVDGARLSHTYDRPDAGDSSTTMVGDGDMRFQPRLTLLSHSTANPTEVPKSSSTSYFYVYAEHDPLISVDGSSIRGVNEEATSGFPVTFNNDTISRPGAYSTFNTNSGSNTYTWNFGEGGGNITVNIGSGAAGDTGVDRSNTFNLSSGEQSGGTTQTYTTTLSINNGHSNSPFSTNLNIIVEPDVRANIAGTADTVSTSSSDNQYTLYDHTDLDGNNRASVTFTNTSQNNDDNEYDFFNDSSDVLTVTEASNGAGSTSATLTKNFTGVSTGAFTTDFKVTGTPDTIHQTDSETITWTMKAIPSAPDGLSSKSFTLSTAAQGTSPKLCAGFDDNTSSFTTLTPGDALNTNTARRYTSTTNITTGTVVNAYDGGSGTLTAAINASASGAKTFTTAENETGTFTNLVVTSNVDYDTVVSTYPQRFYLVFSAYIVKSLASYPIGVSALRLEHSTTGNTNLVYPVIDDVTGTPPTTIGTVAEGTAGTYQYISGIPYYNAGSPTVTVTGTTVTNFTGQAYQDTSSPHEIVNGTDQESTTGSVITDSTYTYAQIDGSTSMLTGGIPNADTGVGTPYTLGVVTVPITTLDNQECVSTIKARSKNANGTYPTYSETSTKIQVFKRSGGPTGLNNEAGGITVSDSLGATYDDDAVRIAGFGSLSGDTPALFDSSNANYYTDSAWSGAVTVAGTNEAITRFGTIKHFTTDLSSGYLPVGPDLNTGRNSGEAQYYTLAFRRTTMSNFTITLTGTVSGCFIAAPGTAIDSASTLNGWLDAGVTYGGSGVPGANTGSGGNGSNGCAFTSGDRIIDGTSYSGSSFTLTLGSENATNATGNVVLVRFKLNSGDSISAVSIS